MIAINCSMNIDSESFNFESVLTLESVFKLLKNEHRGFGVIEEFNDTNNPMMITGYSIKYDDQECPVTLLEALMNLYINDPRILCAIKVEHNFKLIHYLYKKNHSRVLEIMESENLADHIQGSSCWSKYSMFDNGFYYLYTLNGSIIPLINKNKESIDYREMNVKSEFKNLEESPVNSEDITNRHKKTKKIQKSRKNIVINNYYLSEFASGKYKYDSNDASQFIQGIYEYCSKIKRLEFKRTKNKNDSIEFTRVVRNRPNFHDLDKLFCFEEDGKGGKYLRLRSDIGVNFMKIIKILHQMNHRHLLTLASLLKFENGLLDAVSVQHIMNVFTALKMMKVKKSPLLIYMKKILKSVDINDFLQVFGFELMLYGLLQKSTVRGLLDRSYK